MLSFCLTSDKKNYLFPTQHFVCRKERKFISPRILNYSNSVIYGENKVYFLLSIYLFYVKNKPTTSSLKLQHYTVKVNNKRTYGKFISKTSKCLHVVLK